MTIYSFNMRHVHNLKRLARALRKVNLSMKQFANVVGKNARLRRLRAKSKKGGGKGQGQ